MAFRKQLHRLLAVAAGLLTLLFLPEVTTVSAAGPGDVVNCTAPYNISDSEGFVSTDPELVADPAGLVHLFWAERITGAATDSGPPDAVMYAVWDGQSWSEPIDIFLSPQDYFNKYIGGIRGVIDDQGVIHLAWIGPDETFFYSSALASEAGAASAWRRPLKLASDQTGTQFSLDLAYQPPQTLHLLYGRSGQDAPRSVAYIRSEDSGLTWSEPVDIYFFTDLERGASNVRLKVDPYQPNRIYGTWTEWDSSGNGQAILFARSLDGGNTWDYPVILDEREGTEYERDWTNLAVLGENRLAVLWEGGFRAYPQTQYSYDGGATWSDPVDTFYWLIADNGYGEFVYDSAGRLHVFLMRRIREGHDDRCDTFGGCSGREGTNTIWHSVWEGGTHWREPQPVGQFHPEVDGGFTRVGVNRGNQVVLTWFGYLKQEMIVMSCEFEEAETVPLQPWPTPLPEPTATPLPTPTPALTQAGPTPISGTQQVVAGNPQSNRTSSAPNQGMAVFLGVIASALIIAAIIFVQQWRLSH